MEFVRAARLLLGSQFRADPGYISVCLAAEIWMDETSEIIGRRPPAPLAACLAKGVLWLLIGLLGLVWY